MKKLRCPECLDGIVRLVTERDSTICVECPKCCLYGARLGNYVQTVSGGLYRLEYDRKNKYDVSYGPVWSGELIFQSVSHDKIEVSLDLDAPTAAIPFYNFLNELFGNCEIYLRQNTPETIFAGCPLCGEHKQLVLGGTTLRCNKMHFEVDLWIVAESLVAKDGFAVKHLFSGKFWVSGYVTRGGIFGIGSKKTPIALALVEVVRTSGRKTVIVVQPDTDTVMRPDVFETNLCNLLNVLKTIETEDLKVIRIRP